jgi:hypothetical protein
MRQFYQRRSISSTAGHVGSQRARRFVARGELDRLHITSSHAILRHNDVALGTHRRDEGRVRRLRTRGHRVLGHAGSGLTRANIDRTRAEDATKQAQSLNEKLTEALNRERERIKELEKKKSEYVQKL